MPRSSIGIWSPVGVVMSMSDQGAVQFEGIGQNEVTVDVTKKDVILSEAKDLRISEGSEIHGFFAQLRMTSTFCGNYSICKSAISTENGDSVQGGTTMGLERAQALWSRLGWTARVRPMVLGAFIADLFAPDRRTIVETEKGLKFFADPLSNLGESLLRERQYEPETEQIVREHLFTGDSFWTLEPMKVTSACLPRT